MCGIAGFNWKDRELGERMNSCLAHRGPDASGLFEDDGITLAHKRLAVIDLSHDADQPMEDNDKRFVTVFNGEIYNYKELKEELSLWYMFKTKSDTEVILAGYKKWGDKIVNKLNGIFSFAIWDKQEKTLFCARDHVGIKPFYYYWDGKKFIFASEIKSILEHDVSRVLNPDSFRRYMRVLYSPEPDTMIKNIYKLSPGHTALLMGEELQVKSYYAPTFEKKGWKHDEAVRATRKGVEEAVSGQMVSDVPVGVYLSGGIDSSVVLACASKINPNIKTFSVGFELGEGEEREKFNRDSELAKETSKHFGSTHHSLIISIDDVVESFEKVIGSIDDPVSNPTVIAMYHLAKFAKKEVTVVLSGNGGDELFGGYERYRMSRRVDALSKIPGAKYLLPKKIRGAMEMSTLDRLAQFEFEKDHRLSKVVNEEFLGKSADVKKFFSKYIVDSLNKTEGLMIADFLSWLPDQALSLGDRMSMLGSVEERVPLLDRELVDLSMGMPLNLKVTPFNTKKILKEAFRKELPEALFKEPKRGWFSPGAKWLRNPAFLKLIKEILSEGYYSGTKEIFNWSSVQTMLEKHVSKEEYNLTIIWAILTFQIWAKKYKITL